MWLHALSWFYLQSENNIILSTNSVRVKLMLFVAALPEAWRRFTRRSTSSMSQLTQLFVFCIIPTVLTCRCFRAKIIGNESIFAQVWRYSWRLPSPLQCGWLFPSSLYMKSGLFTQFSVMQEYFFFQISFTSFTLLLPSHVSWSSLSSIVTSNLLIRIIFSMREYHWQRIKLPPGLVVHNGDLNKFVSSFTGSSIVTRPVAWHHCSLLQWWLSSDWRESMHRYIPPTGGYWFEKNEKGK